MTRYKDLFGKPESERIREIANTCRARPGKDIAFLVEDDTVSLGKADRYLKKLRNLCPDIQQIKRLAGPVPGVTSVIVRYEESSHEPDDRPKQPLSEEDRAERTAGVLLDPE